MASWLGVAAANPDSQHTRGAADHPLIFGRGPWAVGGGVGRLEGRLGVLVAT